MEHKKDRSDRSSTGNKADATKNPDESSLHQGQGPDFQTQDQNLKEKNPALNEINNREGSEKNDEAAKPPETMEGKREEHEKGK
jgi:hypothetical protein